MCACRPVQKILGWLRFILFPRKEEQDRIFSWIEYCLIWFTSGLIFFAAIYFIAHIIRGYWSPPGPYERLQDVLKTIHEDWHVGLILLIPLFFRPLRVFLENLESIWLAKRFPQPPSGEAKQEQSPPAPMTPQPKR